MSTYQGRGHVNALAQLEAIISDGLTMEEAGRFEDALIVVLACDGKDFARVDMRMRLLMLTDDTIGLRRFGTLEQGSFLDAGPLKNAVARP